LHSVESLCERDNAINAVRGKIIIIDIVSKIINLSALTITKTRSEYIDSVKMSLNKNKGF